MSLMNDALRKKKRELAGTAVAPNFSEPSRRPQSTKRWVILLAGVILLSTATLAGIHLVQATPGSDLLVKTPSPRPSIPPESNAATTSSAAAAPVAGQSHTDLTGSSVATPTNTDPLAVDRPAESPPLVDTGNAQHPQAVERATTMAINAQKPPDKAVAMPSPSMETSTEPSRKALAVTPRNFEPGPDAQDNRQFQPSLARRRSVSGAQRPSAPTRHGPSVIARASQSVQTPKKTVVSNDGKDMFYQKALTYHRSGRLTDAIRLYRQVLRSNAGHPGAMLNLSGAYMQQGNYVEATSLLNRLEQVEPRPEGVLLNLAIAAVGKGNPEQALIYLDRAASASDGSPWEIRFHRAVALARLNRLSEARVLYRALETERPEDPQLQFNLAITCDAMGLYPQALAHYEATLRTPPEASGIDRSTIIQRIRTIRRYLGTDLSAARRK